MSQTTKRLSRRKPRATKRLSRKLIAEPLESRLLLTSLIAQDPAGGSHHASDSAVVTATFDQNINGATATPETFIVHSMQRGTLGPAATSVTTTGATIASDPVDTFFPGELVHVVATSEIESSAADPVVPYVWQFRTAVTAGSGVLSDSGQRIGNSSSRGVALGDLDHDGDLDVFVANVGGGSRIWLNDGSGSLSDTGQSLSGGAEVALGDLDGDGDLDAFVASRNSQLDRLWLNDGNAGFSDSGQVLGDHDSRSVSLGDLDGDGDLDAFVAIANQGNRVWLNDGAGVMSDTGQVLGNHYSYGAALGDIDSDGDLDVLTAHAGQANRLWLNNGAGLFADSGQFLGGYDSGDAALGDLDGDGDLDAFVANYGQGNRVWLNNGNGVLQVSEQSLGDHGTDAVTLGDLDADGDLDAITGNGFYGVNSPGRIWLNDGSGQFSDTGQLLGLENNRDIALGDLDGDGDLDAFFAGGQTGDRSNRVLLNQNLEPSVTLGVDNPDLPESGGVSAITATLSAPHTQPVTIELELSGSATLTEDYLVSGTEIVIPVGATTGSMTVTAVADSIDEPDETVVVDVSAVTNGQESGTQQLNLTIWDDDEPPVPSVTLAVDAASIPEDGGSAGFIVSLSEATTVPVTVDLAVVASSTATQTDDYTVSSLQVSIGPGSTSGSVTVTAVQDDLNEPDETVTLEITSVIGGNESGDQSATTTIIDDDIPPSFRLSSFTPTSGGFQATLSFAVDTSVLSLGDTEAGGHGAADVTLVGATVGAVAGSLVVSPDGRGIEFLATGRRLAADTYTVTLRSADNGFKDTAGNLLDGDANGVSGGDFRGSFTIVPAGIGTVILGIGDFVRGPGQPVNLPADTTDGIPISISIGFGGPVRYVEFRLRFDPALLEVTEVTAGVVLPVGATVTANNVSPGVLAVAVASPVNLPFGVNDLVHLSANVPQANAGENYRRTEVLDIHGITVGDGANNEYPVADNDGLHVAAFLGDVSGNGGINASDASQVARIAASVDSGFAEFLLTDPLIVGDISGNGVINATDASMVARHAVELPVDKIPQTPGGVLVASSGRVSPKQSVGIKPTILVPSPVTIHDRSKVPPAFTALGFAVPVVVPHAATDAMMTRLENPEAADNDELLPALEDAVQQLLSALQI